MMLVVPLLVPLLAPLLVPVLMEAAALGVGPVP